MIHPSRAMVVLLGSAALYVTPASACSPVAGYVVPTTLEMAARADAIVVAQIVGERPAQDGSPPAVLLRPLTLLKGTTLAIGIVVLPDATIDDGPGAVTRSAARELRASNPDTLAGGCVRYLFQRQMRLVLFLKRAPGGGMVPLRSTFARDAEDVGDDGALWVKAVREYAAIARAPRDRWRTMLRSRIAGLRARRGDPDALAIADDMALELAPRRTSRGRLR